MGGTIESTPGGKEVPEDIPESFHDEIPLVSTRNPPEISTGIPLKLSSKITQEFLLGSEILVGSLQDFLLRFLSSFLQKFHPGFFQDFNPIFYSSFFLN